MGAPGRRNTPGGQHDTRLPAWLLMIGLGAIGLGAATPAASQERSAYSYAWCAMYNNSAGPGGARSCYYDTYQQCMRTLSGIGGLCVESPYYHPASRAAPRTAKARHRRGS